MNSKNIATFNDIKSSLNKVYDRIKNSSTQEKGHELFKKIVAKNLTNKTLLFSVINNIQSKLSILYPKEKPPYLNLLSLFFFNQTENESLKLYYQYLSPILSILQSLIVDKNIEILTEISQVYAEIVQYLMPNDISASNKELDPEEKESYEALQSFCILNIKIDQNINRIVGSLCLTKLVENCPFVLKNNYMKYILDNIIDNVSKENFNAKSELLNCLISLILGAESLFCPYANMTLYKILDFLTDKDWQKRKLALNVIYTMIFYCKEEILPLKEHIINFLHVLRTDDIKEVRDVSILILQIFAENRTIKTNNSGNNANKNEDDDTKENKNNKKNINNSYQKVKVIKKANNNTINNTNNNINNTSINNNAFNNTINNTNNNNNRILSSLPNNYSNKNKKDNYETNFNKRNSNESNKMSLSSNKGFYKENSISTDKKLSVNKRNNSFGKRKKFKTYKSNSRDKYENEENGKRMEYKSPIQNSARLSKDSDRNEFELKYPKYVNRKKDLSFINQKMVIRPDPNKSIFNSNKNMAFFQQANSQKGDIIVIPKENKSNYNTYNSFYKPKKFGINKDENEIQIKKNKSKSKNKKKDKEKEKDKDKDKEKKIENKNINFREKIDKDYDDSIDNINKLITLDAKIKADNNKHIDNFIKDDKNNDEDNYKENENKNNIYRDKNYENNDNNEDLNNNNIDVNNTNLLNLLLSEVRALSNKQISLLDLMDDIQTNTQQQIEDLNEKIEDLDDTVKDLNHQLYILQKNQ